MNHLVEYIHPNINFPNTCHIYSLSTYLWEPSRIKQQTCAQKSSSMANFTLSLFLLSLSRYLVPAHAASPYLAPSTFFNNYQKMLTIFKIFIYTPPQPFTNFSTPPASLFYHSLLNSPFVTQDPNQAHLYLVPFSPDTSARSLGRVVRELRTKYPYWNRTLGADHFFISPTGIDFSSDRNVLELKKNSIQISLFPTTSGNFIPHKDITLPPVPSLFVKILAPRRSFLAYLKWDGKTESNLVNELRLDPEFVVESQPFDQVERVSKSNSNSKFCLFFYQADVAGMTEAMAAGCVPVVIVDRPVQDLPLTDLLRWSKMALLVGNSRGAKGLSAVLHGVTEVRYAEMRELCVAATHHMVWNVDPQPYDAFHMVMYQLWMRRHTIRYARWEDLES